MFLQFVCKIFAIIVEMKCLSALFLVLVLLGTCPASSGAPIRASSGIAEAKLDRVVRSPSEPASNQVDILPYAGLTLSKFILSSI